MKKELGEKEDHAFTYLLQHFKEKRNEGITKYNTFTSQNTL